jgi:predicted amidohydrolase YtcJ
VYAKRRLPNLGTETKGTLEPGRLADIIVLPEDPPSIAPERLLNLKIDMTIGGGKVLYQREAS